MTSSINLSYKVHFIKVKPMFNNKKKVNRFSINTQIISVVFTLILILFSDVLCAQNNLSLTGKATSSGHQDENSAELAIDGKDNTSWISIENAELKWLSVVLPGALEIEKIEILIERINGNPVQNYAIQTYLNGKWHNRIEESKNQDAKVIIAFKKPILTDRLRFVVNDTVAVKIKEFEIYGKRYIDENVAPVKKVLINQSGYNLGKPKRFTTPEIDNNTPFNIKNLKTNKVEFQGKINNNIGDFTEFNPKSSDEYVIAIDTIQSYPFRIAPFWLERITYQNMVDFMNGARHYTGTTDQIRRLSWAWRDGDFFNWALQNLVAQYLSNPEAYSRLEKKISYVSNDSFSEEYKGKWGVLKPYKEDAPDIVKLIHWDADVKISQQLEHEMQKAELAHFLYAFPYLKEWLPQQNFDLVYKYLKTKWDKADVEERSTSQYDQSPEHNLLALKTKMGTNKGELPPGHSIIPNLMMYEVAKNQKEKDAEKYFTAAFNQMKWMIANLDWQDPLTTKGQRMSEHITMRAFAYFYNQYPKKAPKGIVEKVEDWVDVMMLRSNNMWDFRKYTDHGDWVPAGWNETGNILSFPASVLAAKSIIKDETTKKELDRLVWSHFDDAFGRNPTGRHFSYDGAREIEGVDLGWYNAHHGGVGLLEPVRFVFDGSPKTNHYPNHPEIGNLGWTEGWVQHNTAFNISMAYLAHDEVNVQLKHLNKKTLAIRLKAPLNFDENRVDHLGVNVVSSGGDAVIVTLKEEGPYSKYLTGIVKYKYKKMKKDDELLQVKKGDTISVSYGLGYFEKKGTITIK